jgi:transposase
MTRIKEISCVSCCECGGKLRSIESPERHQTIDLPKTIALEHTEYRLHRYRCQDCGKRQKAELPREVGRAIMGPRFTSLCAVLTGSYGLTVRKTQRLLNELTGESWSVGTLFAGQQRIAEALKATYNQIKISSDAAPWAGADETGWRTCGQRRYIWLKSTLETTFLRITASRSRACAEELLSKTPQPVVTDRYAAYAPTGPHQYCLAHLARDIEGLRVKDASLCDVLLYDLREIFGVERRYRKKRCSRGVFLAKTAKAMRRMKQELFSCSIAHEDDGLQQFCERVLRHWPKFWTFRQIEGMHPTNNCTERDLRSLVIKRKISFGTRSDLGERFIERIYSVMETLKKRGHAGWGFVTDTLLAYRRGLPVPRLPPVPA